MFICLMFPLTFNMNFTKKDVAVFFFSSERFVRPDQSPRASEHLPVLSVRFPIFGRGERTRLPLEACLNGLQ